MKLNIFSFLIAILACFQLFKLAAIVGIWQMPIYALSALYLGNYALTLIVQSSETKEAEKRKEKSIKRHSHTW